MLPLFAFSERDFWVLIAVAVALLALAAAGLILFVLFLLTLHRTLARCRPDNRAMAPALVWLNLVPLWNLFWQFATVSRMTESLEAEFRARGGHRAGARFGHDFGIAAGSLHLACVVTLILPQFSWVFGLLGLVCGGVYWVKIVGYGRRLTPRTGGEEDEGDDRW